MDWSSSLQGLVWVAGLCLMPPPSIFCLPRRSSLPHWMLSLAMTNPPASVHSGALTDTCWEVRANRSSSRIKTKPTSGLYKAGSPGSSKAHLLLMRKSFYLSCCFDTLVMCVFSWATFLHSSDDCTILMVWYFPPSKPLARLCLLITSLKGHACILLTFLAAIQLVFKISLVYRGSLDLVIKGDLWPQQQKQQHLLKCVQHWVKGRTCQFYCLGLKWHL